MNRGVVRSEVLSSGYNTSSLPILRQLCFHKRTDSIVNYVFLIVSIFAIVCIMLINHHLVRAEDQEGDPVQISLRIEKLQICIIIV